MKLKLERICEWLGAVTMPGHAGPRERGNINKVWSNNMMLCVSSCKKEREIDNLIPRKTFCGNKLQSMVVRVTIRTPQTQVSRHNIYKRSMRLFIIKLTTGKLDDKGKWNFTILYYAKLHFWKIVSNPAF